MIQSTPAKVREARLRRMAKRQGLVVQRTRRRDPRAIDYGTYTVRRGADALAEGLDIDGLEDYLTK